MLANCKQIDNNKVTNFVCEESEYIPLPSVPPLMLPMIDFQRAGKHSIAENRVPSPKCSQIALDSLQANDSIQTHFSLVFNHF